MTIASSIERDKVGLLVHINPIGLWQKLYLFSGGLFDIDPYADRINVIVIAPGDELELCICILLATVVVNCNPTSKIHLVLVLVEHHEVVSLPANARGPVGDLAVSGLPIIVYRQGDILSLENL